MSVAFNRELHPLGTHRVIEPPGAVPQTAARIDNTPVAMENEILCDVEALNIESASFKQISQACGCDPLLIGEHIMRTARERGKQHNPVTNSGGMFIGRVLKVGERLRDRVSLHAGDRIASLVSLTMTPLYIESVCDVDAATGRVRIRGKAILFETAAWAKLPGDIPDDVALAVLEVAAAPAHVQRAAKPGMTVVVVGAGGKSGMLSCAQAKRQVGPDGVVIGIAPNAQMESARTLERAGIVDRIVECDARDALRVSSQIAEIVPDLADLVVNCVNVPGTELGSILAAKDEGTVYFFSLATSFTAASLGAAGAGKDVTMMIGNGYAKGHADIALGTLREHPEIRDYFIRKYVRNN